MAQKGKSMVVYVNVGTDAAPQWEPVAGQRGFSRSRTASSIDAGDKLSSVRKKLAGDREESYSLSGTYVPDDIAFQKLDNAYRSGSLVKVRTYNLGLPKEEVLCSITSMSEDHPDGEVSTISIELVPSSDPIVL